MIGGNNSTMTVYIMYYVLAAISGFSICHFKKV